MKVKALIISVAFIALLLPQYNVQAASPDEQGIEEFIVKLYEAKKEGDENLLVNIGASEKEIILSLALVECGLQEYHNIQSHIYQSGENTWLVFVGYEMEAEGVDVWLPGLRSEFVIKDEQGQFMLLPWEIEATPLMVNKHREITMANPEITDLVKACDDSYNQVIQNDIYGEAQDFIEKVIETRDNIEIERYLVTENSSQDEKSTKNETGHYYTVRPGDCLWSISEEYLESGQNWRLLYKKNREMIGESPELIFPGQQLELEID